MSESCDSLCSCMLKDGILYLNCEQRNISKISQIKIPPGVPFHLNLYKNDLVELLAEEMEGLKNALSLHIGGNSIQELDPGVFSALGSLKKLHINSNFLVTLREDTFQGLVNLEFLQADTNFIQVIEPGAFNKLIRLKVLILNDNSIEFLPNNIFRFVPLTHLDLRGNKLQTLPYVGFLEHIGRIMELLLEDNDWACDCDILHLKIWMENMRAQSAIGDVVCSTPQHLKGTILAKVKRDVLCPSHADINLEEPSKSLDMVVTPSSKGSQIPKLVDAKDESKATTPSHIPNGPCVEHCSCHNHPVAGFLMHCQDRGIQKLDSLEQIYLEDNPWDCTCDLLSLKQWVDKLKKDTVVGSILCHTPKKAVQAELRTIHYEVLCPGLGTYYPVPPEGEESSTATLGPDLGKGFLSSLTDTVPLSVLILSLLMFVLMVVFCSAGLVVFVVHRRRRRAKKKAVEEQPRENTSSSPIHLHYSMYGQKTTHHTLTQRTGSSNLYEERSHSPIVQICRNPTYCSQHKEHDTDLDYGLDEPSGKHHFCRSIMEKENTSPLTGTPGTKFRPMTGECSGEFVSLGSSNSLYRNILEREKELQQLGITEYLRKNMSQLQSAVDIQVPGHQEELKLMETIVYSRPHKVMLEQTKNEYFELKANLHTEPDYLEVLEHQTAFN
ncbi:SLIT and NTRK-like protein 6 [Takifugu flavidus]|uniref:SLIT and NTRK-like protein 6 n=1 Tax=Takifugu flavidus TaxID=433684 RepID=A0A5C6NCD9_9TELE|nr:SLIT and NTRK-like protein 6 [Takifugu flavidus]